MAPHRLSRLFDPRSIAVIGASNRADSVGGRVFRNLLEGFEGPVYPVNPKREKVQKQRCWPAVADLPELVDLALIASPARTLPGIFEELGAAGIRNAVVLTAGFGETGAEGRKAERRLLRIAERHGIRFIGPNCVGLLRPWAGMNASFLPGKTPPGKLALLSQSGALCSAIADYAEPNHLGFSALVSLGNSTDIGFGEALSFLASDEKTEAILLYVEGVRQARSFISELRAAARLKPVVVLKGGRHQKSSVAAHTHTGALVGSNEAFDAALERAGAVRAGTFGQLFAAAEMLSAHRRAGSNRLCIITNGGGAGVLAADAAEGLGLDLASPSEKTIEKLDALLPAYWSRSNPVDILGDAAPELYGEATRLCLADPNFDGVLVMLTPQAMTRPDDAADELIAARKGSSKPVLACFMGAASVADARRKMSAAGIPEFATPERAVEAFSHLAQHERNRRLSHEVPAPRLWEGAPEVPGARMIVEAALAEGRNLLSDLESKALLRAFGIPTVTTIEASTPTRALIAAEMLGFPVVMKIHSPQITHKTDVDGVRTGITHAAEIRPIFQEIMAAAREKRPNAEILGVTVENMAGISHARELLVGVVRDPVFGPTIAFGSGGTMVEVMRDSAVALPPLTTVIADRLIERTRVAELLKAHRNQPAADLEAIIDVLMRVSDMVVELPELTGLDINPLFAGPDGVVAVDARITIARPSGAAGPYDHLAIAPYPRHLVEDDFLADGTPLTIRPIRPEDATSEQDFVRSLSSESRRWRFLQAVKELSPAMLAQVTQIDYAREMALIATITEADGERQVGTAQYVIDPNGRSCEFAIAVSDDMQGRGIGSRLMKSLMVAARLHGLSRMSGIVLSANTPMLRFMREIGFSVSAVPGDMSLVRVERRL